MSKRKLIRIKYCKGLYSDAEYKFNFQITKPNFAFAGTELKLNNKGERTREQISRWVTCREQLSSIPWYSFHKKHYDYIYTYSDKSRIDFSNIRLLIGIQTNFDEASDRLKSSVFSAKYVANIIEQYAGWETSTITSIKHKNHIGSNDRIWLFTGPTQWISLPYMVSLISLIFRWAIMNKPYDVENIDQLVQLGKSIHNQNLKDDGGTGHSLDDEYFALVMPYIKPFLENFDKIFEGDYTSTYYPEKWSNGMQHYGGIYGLFNKKTGNGPLHKRLQHYVLNK